MDGCELVGFGVMLCFIVEWVQPNHSKAPKMTEVGLEPTRPTVIVGGLNSWEGLEKF